MATSIVICADAHLAELQIQRAHILLHYSLPTSWTLFNYRYATLIGNYPIFNEERSSSSNIQRRNMSVILLDEENNKQLPRLVDFMQKHQQQVHPKIMAVAKNIRQGMEKRRQRKGVPLCEQVLEFGECDNRECTQRHCLSEKDVDNRHDLPESGEIHLSILKVSVLSIDCLVYQRSNNFTESSCFSCKGFFSHFLCGTYFTTQID